MSEDMFAEKRKAPSLLCHRWH